MVLGGEADVISTGTCGKQNILNLFACRGRVCHFPAPAVSQVWKHKLGAYRSYWLLLSFFPWFGEPCCRHGAYSCYSQVVLQLLL